MQASNYNPASAGPQQYTPPRPRSRFVQALGIVALAASMIGGPAAAVYVDTQLHTAAHVTTSQALPSTGTGAPARSQYFTPTGKVVAGDFLGTLERFGLAQIGYPITDERQENGATVQYFERVRMEKHPELASRGYSVLMTRLGVDLAGAPFPKVTPFASSSARMYVTQTGHSLSGVFLTYWKGNGSVELFGYPISEPMTQNGLTVQWFERARFEYHPELSSKGKAVQLSHLGRMALEKSGSVQAKIVPQEPVAQPQAAPAQVSLSSTENYLLTGINQQRAAAGLQPVQIDATVTSLSRSRSTDMADRNYFSHQTPEGKNFLSMMGERKIGYKFAGEILARNNYPDAEASKVAIESYLNSPAHRAIMLDGRFNLVGIGYTRSAEDGMQYFTVIFVQR